MKRLIVNADDLGADEPRNAGIFEAIAAGVVTSASILANGPALDDVLRRIRFSLRKSVSFGIHLNLSEGRPLTRNLQYLAGPDGFFPGKARSQEVLQQWGDAALKEEIYRETAAQVEALLKSGVPITHLDGHQHLQVFPAVIETALRAAEALGVPWIRIPAEPPERLSNNRFLETEARMFARFAAEARPCAATSNVRVPDHFRGLYLKGRLTPSLLNNMLARLPDGLTELMVHPGRVPVGKLQGPFSSFSTRDRETELMVLLGSEFRDALSKYGISLTPFPEENA